MWGYGREEGEGVTDIIIFFFFAPPRSQGIFSRTPIPPHNNISRTPGRFYDKTQIQICVLYYNPKSLRSVMVWTASAKYYLILYFSLQ